MFKLSLLDRNGNVLNIGDIVKVVNTSHGFTLYTEIKWLEDEKVFTLLVFTRSRRLINCQKTPKNPLIPQNMMCGTPPTAKKETTEQKDI